MKRLIGIVTFLGVCIIPVLAQEELKDQITLPLSQPGKRGVLEVDQINGDISIQGYDGKEVIINITGESGLKDVGHHNHQHNDTPPGMKRISSNPASIEAIEDNNRVRIETESWKMKTNLVIKLPKNFDLEIHTIHGMIEVTEVEGMLDLSSVNGSITINNVRGTVVSNTVNGFIRGTMASVKPEVPMSFVTLNGDVDITFPATLKATTKMQSERGEIFTDFDMNTERSKIESKTEDGRYKVEVNSWIYGKINGGGPEYTFKNMHGNIIIRKK